MKLPLLFLLAPCLGLVSGQAQNLTASMIEKMGNNTLFERWRPVSRFLAPHGWMNDPCGLMYDPVGGLYHAFYQWHPYHANWGNISWGHATSKDLVTWTDVVHHPHDNQAGWQGNQAEAFGTTNLTSNHHTPAKYNHLGIWSGSAQPVNITGEMDGTLLAFYTSIATLPLSWNAPYPNRTESQSFVYSYDGGITWQEYAGNPIISNPPGNWNITGFRDPSFGPWPQMDAFLGLSEPHYYLVCGSGIGDVGPRMPLYIAPASNLTNWTFMGALWQPKGNHSLGNEYETGPWGWNFEVPNFFSIGDHYFTSTGTQGASTSWHPQNWVIWNEGIISKRDNGSVAFEPISGGAVDWGLLYAIPSFNDTKNNRRIQYGWAWEDTNNFGMVQAGYQGAFSLPRELFVKETSNVVGRKNQIPGNSVFTKQPNGTYTARTLGVRPASDVVAALRANASYASHEVQTLGKAGTFMLGSAFSTSYEFRFEIESTSGLTGLRFAASPDLAEYTDVFFDPFNNTIGCNRTHSTLIKEFVNTTYVGFFEPYQTNTTGTPITETITFDIFVDGSLVEIYVNDRFALTSRVYPSQLDSTGAMLFAGKGVSVTYGSIEVWSGLKNAWPERPQNSSSLLVFDTAAETGNYTWWPGW